MNTWTKIVPSLFLAGGFITLAIADKCLLNYSDVMGSGQNLAKWISLGTMLTLIAGILATKIIFGDDFGLRSLERRPVPIKKESVEAYKFLGIGQNFTEWSHLHRTADSQHL